MADRYLIDAWTSRLREEVPGSVAILLKGSHVRSDAGRHSDIDFDVLVDGPPIERYPFWIEPDDTDRLRHVSVAVQDLDGWLATAHEPEPWAFGLPVREPTRLLWAATAELTHRLGQPWREHPPAEPEIEDWFESVGKMRNAAERGDELGLRQAAQELGRYTPTLLRPLNPQVWATSPRSALDLALAFPIAPEAYRDDVVACLGLSGAVTIDELIAAAERLATGTLSMVRDHIEVFAPLLDSNIAGHLRDGTLERYIEQMTAGSP